MLVHPDIDPIAFSVGPLAVCSAPGGCPSMAGCSAKPRPRGAVSGLFLAGYGIFRFIAEFGREPDAYLGYLALGLSMGQWLSLPMIGAGLVLFGWSVRKPRILQSLWGRNG